MTYSRLQKKINISGTYSHKANISILLAFDDIIGWSCRHVAVTKIIDKVIKQLNMIQIFSCLSLAISYISYWMFFLHLSYLPCIEMTISACFLKVGKGGSADKIIKFLWCLFWQHYWCTWGSIHPSNWQAHLSFWATACWLCWCIQQFRMQWRPSVPGLWIHQIQWWSWHWGFLPIPGCKWSLPFQECKCWCQSFGLS